MDFDDLFGFKSADEYHRKLDDAFHKLCVEPCQTVPSVGDRVVIATGLIGRGHLWERVEAPVIEVGDTSVCVELISLGKPERVWIHPALITDVLPEKATP